MVWLCEHGEGLGLETLSSDYHPVLLFSVPSAPTLLETAGTTKYRPQSLWESSAQAELLLAFPHPGPQIQRVIYESAATHPSVFKPRHVLSSLCGLVRYRVLLPSFRRVSRRSWRKCLCVVCTWGLTDSWAGKEKVAHRSVDGLSRRQMACWPRVKGLADLEGQRQGGGAEPRGAALELRRAPFKVLPRQSPKVLLNQDQKAASSRIQESASRTLEIAVILFN